MRNGTSCPQCGRPFLVGDRLIERVNRRWSFFGMNITTEYVHLDCDKAKIGEQVR